MNALEHAELTRRAAARLTKMMLNSVNKRLSKSERDLWQRQAWMTAKKLERGELI